MNIIRGSVVGLAGAVGGGLLIWPAVTAADTPETELYKRDERSTELALADVDDDDSRDRDRDTDTRSRNSRADTSRAAGKDTTGGVDRARAADATDDANERGPYVSRDTTDNTTGESIASRGSDVSRDFSQPSTVSRDQSRDVSRDDSDDSDDWSRDDSSVD